MDYCPQHSYENNVANEMNEDMNEDFVEDENNEEEDAIEGDVDTNDEEDGMEQEGFETCDIGGVTVDERFAIDGMVDIAKINANSLTVDEVSKYHFFSLDVAFMFYNWYGRSKGFSARRDKILRTKKGEIVQQTFVCCRQGYRRTKGINSERRKRRAKHETRCGCEAKFHVHVDTNSGRWYVTHFFDVHSHPLLDGKSCGLLAGHRQMSEADVIQMNNYLKVGITTPQIFGCIANQSGGFFPLQYILKDVYNQIGRQRKSQADDAKGAIAYLRGLAKTDPLMFWRHTTDAEDRLQHLFWCDGTSQLNYTIFGDVVAFDATYCKNKYMCPVVFFSGVNHHNQTTIFASAFIANETEETYVWLLQQFLEAMKGKAPVSVITDGDLAMRNAIKRIFPNAHHRLCAWHLLRNAASNVGIPDFASSFGKCMLGDYEVGKFNRMWEAMVEKFGLEENNWVKEMYEKKKMWATAHLRGNFFAGYRTTSRCEGFNSQILKFVKRRNSLTQFLQGFHRCLERMRFSEFEADFASAHGVPVLQTQFRKLEKSGARVFTKEMFDKFQKKLQRSSIMQVIGCRETASSIIYTLGKYGHEGTKWRVSFYPPTNDFKCSCLRMESYGMPCEHILAVLVYLNVMELPKCLINNRWTQNARESIERCIVDGNGFWDSTLMARYTALIERCREMCNFGCRTLAKFHSTFDLICQHTEGLKLDDENDVNVNLNDTTENGDDVLNPVCVRTKGGASSSRRHDNGKRRNRCGVCRAAGHNRKSCPIQRQIGGTSQHMDDNAEGNFYNEEYNVGNMEDE